MYGWSAKPRIKLHIGAGLSESVHFSACLKKKAFSLVMSLMVSEDQLKGTSYLISNCDLYLIDILYKGTLNDYFRIDRQSNLDFFFLKELN